MMFAVGLRDLAVDWGSYYSNHAVVRTFISFAHVFGLAVGGGAAIVADRGDGTAEHLTGRRSFLKCAGALGTLFSLPIVFGESVLATGPEYQYPIPSADGVTIDRKAQVIVVRYQQHLYAFNLACPHENTA